MPPSNIALRLIIRWCGVIVAPTFGPAASTKTTASAVVMCSRTIFSPGKSCNHLRKHAVDEHGLTVENVDVVVRDLPVEQQRHPQALHDVEDAEDTSHVGHAPRGVGGRMRRVELGRGEYADLKPRSISAGSMSSVR